MYPIYLPGKYLYTQKLVHHEHLHTLHGGVALTMTSVRGQHRVPHLRKLAKQTIPACHGCKRFQAKAAANLPPGNLPVDWTQGFTQGAQGVHFKSKEVYCKKGETRENILRQWLYICWFSQLLAQNEIVWQFNLSCVLWWGGQFETGHEINFFVREPAGD